MTNGIINLSSSNTKLAGRLVWSATQNVANNSSNVTVEVQLKRSSSKTWGTWAVTVDLTKVPENWNGERDSRIDVAYIEENIHSTVSSSWVTLKTITATVPHLADGNLTLNLYAFIQAPSGTSLEGAGVYTDSWGVDFVLDKIYQKAVLTAAPNFTSADNPTISYSNPLGEQATTLQACIATSTGGLQLAKYRDIPKLGSSYTFTLTDEERNALYSAVTSGNSVTVSFYIQTGHSNGSVFYDAQLVTFTLVEPNPTLAPAVVDMNSATSALTGDINKFIKGYSNAACDANATFKYGASLAQMMVANGAVTEWRTDTDYLAINNVEDSRFIFMVKDTRGNSSGTTIDVPMIDYIKPTCSQTVEIELSGETGAVVTLTIEGKYFNRSFGAVANELVLQVRHTDNDGNMSDWVTLTDGLIPNFSGDTYNLTTTISGFEYDRSYTFQCRAEDKLSSATSGENTVRLYPVFDWGESDFNFNVPVTIQGNPLTDFVIETGTEAMGTNGTWYWEKWASGKAVCWGRRNYGNMAVGTAWGNWYESPTYSQALPTGLFIDIPDYIDINIVKTTSGTSGIVIQGYGGDASATSTGTFSIARATSATLSQVHLGFYASGRWK